MNASKITSKRARRSGELRVAAINRVADRIDLAIDLLTLGQYGLECREAMNAEPNGCEGSKRPARNGSSDAWEASCTPRRPGCEWQWPQRIVLGDRPRA
jgi:hypothetical protein